MRITLIILAIFLSVYSFAARAIVNDKELRVPLHVSMITLDPGGIQDTQSLIVSRQVNCQLIRNQGSTYALDAAESIKYVTPLKVVLKIKNNAKFHDGTVVTSADILASFSYVRKSRSVFRNLLEWVSSIDIVDDKTIVFILKKPTAQFLKVLSSNNYTIFKKTFIEDAEKDKKLWQKPLGCGGYKVLEFTADHVRLTPVSNGLPIIFYLHKAKDINANELEQYDIVESVAGQSKELNKFNMVEILDPVQYFLGLNSISDKWKEKRDRCRFLSELNTKELLASYDGSAVEANDFLPKGTIGYNSNGNFNGDLLDLSQKENKAVPVANDKLKAFCLSYLTVSVQEKSKSAYLNMVKAIYPNAYMKPIRSVKKFGRNFFTDKCDAFVFALWSSSLDGYEYLTLFEDNDANFSGVYNKKLIAKITESQSLSNANARSAQYQEIVSEIKKLCVVKTLFTIPTKKIYIRKDLIAPGIGLGAYAHYYLGNITR